MSRAPVGVPVERVLDASALLAYLHLEPGAEAVELRDATVSAVNWCEVVERAERGGADVAGLRAHVEAHGCVVVDFDAARAEAAAALWPPTRAAGLSLGDRACLALALELDVPAVTADREWVGLDVGVEVVVVRG